MDNMNINAEKITTCKFCFISCCLAILASSSKGDHDGYYAFEESSLLQRPPRVRKPPYVQTEIPCTTGEIGSRKSSPIHTLCGDLNKGFIPLNPMGQAFNGKSYPFALIRNKTLLFLSNALPYLQYDKNLPKVARLGSDYYFYRYSPNTVTQHQRQRRGSGMKIENDDIQILLNNETTGRQFCDQRVGNSFLCTLTSFLLPNNNNKLSMALMNAVAQGVSAMASSTGSPSLAQVSGDVTENSAPSVTDSVLKLLGTLATHAMPDSNIIKTSGNTENNNNNELSSFAHALSVLTGASLSSPSTLSLILKFLSSEISPLKTLAGAIPSRRRRPVADDVTIDTSPRRPQKVDNDLPPTPCPSSEEYVTPIFAKNYQGVWKYVVQIPQEGYFTQTVQQTKCVKNECDFLDGICRESPRWVSLLVAETFYPNAFFPTSAPQPLPSVPPPVEDFYNFQQYLKRRVGEGDDQISDYKNRLGHKKNPKFQQHCDGFDNIGCYLVRLYYDWFLINGSCKCWKPSIKGVLTGK